MKPKTKIDEYGRVCTMCGEYKHWVHYHLNPTFSNGYNSRCKKCMSAVNANGGSCNISINSNGGNGIYIVTANITEQDTTPPSVSILKPKKAIYINDKEIM